MRTTNSPFAALLLAIALSPQGAPGATIHVPSGGDLQAAIDAAAPGDTITLAPGATYRGLFTLRAKTGNEFITIRISDPGLIPPDGQRISPAWAPSLPKLISVDNRPVLRTERGAHHYRLVGIEIKPPPGVYASELIALDTPRATSVSEQPAYIELDRLYIHGDPSAGTKRGITLNSSHTVIKNCYISDIKSTWQDSQAIGGWNGPGPYEIVNNYLEASGENVMFGGALPSIQGLVPSDIVFRRNYCYKPTSWRKGSPDFAGTVWIVKNSFELKNARRVLIEENIFENNWQQAQAGFAIVFTVRAENGAAPWAVIEDVTFTRNIVARSGAGVNILARDNSSNYQGILRRMLIKDNLFIDIDHTKWGGEGRLFQLLHGPEDLTIEHNTLISENIRHAVIFDGNYPSVRFVYNDNISAHGAYGVYGNAKGTGTVALAYYAPGYVFSKNILAGGSSGKYPPDNYFPSNLRSVGFVDYDNGDYNLSNASRYKGAGTGGSDVGANVFGIISATSGVRQGVDNTNKSPSVSSVTPSAGSGLQQAFQFVFSDANGGSDISGAFMAFSATLDDASACYVRFVSENNSLMLRADDGTSWLGPVQAGTAGNLSSRRCTVDTVRSTVSRTADQVSLTLALDFSPSFYGQKGIFAYAEDRAGANSGWSQLGTWTPSENIVPSVGSVTPSSGEGSLQKFTFVVSDGNGFEDLRAGYLLINTRLSGAGACYIRYLLEDNSLSLRDDLGSAWLEPVAVGGPGTLSNSQCRIDASTSSAAGSGDNLTVSVSVQFTPVFYGTKFLYLVAEDRALVISGWQQKGTWIPGRNEPPEAVSVTPSSGEGAAQVFQLAASDPNTSADLRSVRIVMNNTLSAVNGCYVIYQVVEKTLWLRDDADLNWLGPLTAQSPGTVRNSQCSVDAGASGASLSGNRLTLSLALAFHASFSGPKDVYLLAEDKSFLVSGWKRRGTWIPSPNEKPAAVSVAPSSGEGLQQAFQFVVSDPNGSNDLRAVHGVINGVLSSASGCHLLYRPVEETLWLRDDAGANWLGPATIGTAATLANGQCLLNVAASAASKSGNQLTLTAALSFRASFFGTKRIFLLAEDSAFLSSGWQSVGSWTPVQNLPPVAESATPSSGEGMAAVFQFVFSDPNGATDLRSGHILVSGVLSPASACYSRYQPASGLWLRDDAGSNWLGPLTPGSGGTLSNSQCAVGLRSVTRGEGGDQLSVSLAIEFQPAFSGAKNIFMLAEDIGYLNSGWQNRGAWTVSSASRVIHVPPGGNLQRAIDQAQPGDTITLEPGATYSGNFVLRRKTGNDFITITTADPGTLPPPGTRVTPAAAVAFPKVLSPTNAAVFSTETGAHHYRLVGLEIAAAAGIYTLELISLGSSTATTTGDLASDIELDRLYLHGHPSVGGKRAITLNSAATVIRNCWIADFKSPSQDTQAIGGWNGPGPYTIVNNHLEAAGAGLMLGGAAARIAGLTPSDITIRGNHFFKPVAWRSEGRPARNLLVIENGRRVLIEGNLFENNWAGADPQGFAVVFAVRTHNGAAPWAVIEDVTFTRNLVRAAAAGLRIEGRDASGGGALRRLLVQDNLVYAIDHTLWGGEGRLFDLAGAPEDVTIDHNTCLQHPAGRHLLGFAGPAAVRFTFTNNVATHGRLGVVGANQATGTATLNAYAPGATFLKNALIGGDSAQYPAENFFPPDVASVGFSNPAGDDYRLAPSSPYTAAGTDGKNLGADVNAVSNAVAEVTGTG